MSPLFLLVPILLPIIGGYLIIFFRFQEDRPREVFAEAVACLTTAAVWLALWKVERFSPVVLYSFTRGFSIALGIDRLSLLFAGMVSLMWPPVLLYAFEYMRKAKRKNVFFAFYVMTYGVTLGVAFAGNLTTLYVFYEMLSLVTIPLVVHYGNHESMYAGRVYAAYTIGGAAAAFFPVVLTTILTEGGNFRLGGFLSGAGTQILMLAFLFGFFGFGTKAAVFPLCRWLPLASAAPTPVTALLHAVAVVNSGVFAVTRLAWYVYGPELLFGTGVQVLCVLTAAFTLIYAAVRAIRARHFKRRLAWSTVSNLSYMLFGIMLMTPDGLRGGLLHMLFHGIIKMSLFLCAGAFMHQTGHAYLYEVNGVGRRMPVTFFMYTLGALSLTGIPTFCGFVSKWNLLTAAAETANMAGAGSVGRAAMTGLICLIGSAFLCAVYTLTVSARAFFPPAETDRYADGGGEDAKVREAGFEMLFPIVLFGLINIFFGVFPAPALSFMEGIAAGL